MKHRIIAYCIDADCHCDHRAGLIIRPDEVDYYRSRGYDVREEIRGGVYNGMTDAEVIAARDAYNRLF